MPRLWSNRKACTCRLRFYTVADTGTRCYYTLRTTKMDCHWNPVDIDTRSFQVNFCISRLYRKQVFLDVPCTRWCRDIYQSRDLSCSHVDRCKRCCQWIRLLCIARLLDRVCLVHKCGEAPMVCNHRCKGRRLYHWDIDRRRCRLRCCILHRVDKDLPSTRRRLCNRILYQVFRCNRCCRDMSLCRWVTCSGRWVHMINLRKGLSRRKIKIFCII